MPPEDMRSRAEARLDEPSAQATRQALITNVTAAPADDDSLDSAFENESYRYVSEWLAVNQHRAANAAPFALVLSRSISLDESAIMQAVPGMTVKHFHAFRNQTVIDVQGCLFVSTMNLERAIAVPIDKVSATQQLFDRIADIGMSERNIIAFEPSNANLILQRRGLGQGSRKQQVLPPGSQPWSLGQLETAIDQFHNDQTRAPSGVLVPWANAGEGITGERLEIRISKALAYDLDRAWPRGSVLAELETYSGRMDIYVTAAVLQPGSGPCVLEVKVLRDHRMRRNSAGKRVASPMPSDFAEWWAKKGIIQADLYRRDKKAPNAYLCSFDARDKETELPSVMALAAQRNVFCKNYFMHRSSESLQAAELAESEPL